MPLAEPPQLVGIRRLRDVAARLAELDEGAGGAAGRWFANLLKEYEAGAPRGARLDELAGLISGPGQEAWWTIETRRRRNELIRVIARQARSGVATISIRDAERPSAVSWLPSPAAVHRA
jgi:hypothetical protein